MTGKGKKTPEREFLFLFEYKMYIFINIFIMKEVGDILGYKVVVKDVAFPSIFTEVQNNKMAVGAAGITVNAERQATGLFTNTYSTSVQYVIAKKGTLDSIKNPDNTVDVAKLTSMSIGVQEGTTGCFLIQDAINGTEGDGGEHVEGSLENKNSNCIEYKNAIIASGDIGSALQVVVIDKLPAQQICASNSTLECFALTEAPEDYAIYCNKEATELVAKINGVIEILKDNGFIDYLISKHSGAFAA